MKLFTQPFNASLDDEGLPVNWVTLSVIPVQKRTLRAGSLTPILLKTFEGAMIDKILGQLEEGRLIMVDQRGFENKRAFLNNFISFFDEVASGLE